MENNNELNTNAENNFQSVPSTPNQPKVKLFSFHGSGSELFRIFIINAVLTLLTLGLYYPWAKAKILSYNYGHTEFLGNRFTFHGTGKEMFRGFVMGILLIASWYGLSWLLQSYLSAITYLFVSGVISISGIVLLTPLLIHGTLKYRTSRSSWRGLYFQYHGTRKDLYKIMGKLLAASLGTFLLLSSFFVFGSSLENRSLENIFSLDSMGFYNLSIALTMLISVIYYIWIKNEVYKYVFSKLKLGNMEFKYTGEASYFFLNYLYLFFASFVIMIIFFTLSAGFMSSVDKAPVAIILIVMLVYGTMIYFYLRLGKRFFNYKISNMRMHQYNLNKKGTLKSTSTTWDWFVLYAINILIIVFTLGIATPWAMVRTMKFYSENIYILGGIDFDAIEQHEVDLTGNTNAEGLYDAFDYDFQII